MTRQALRPGDAAARVLLLVLVVYYVLSNAALLHNVLPSQGKHLLFALLAALSLMTRSVDSVRAVMVASPIAAIYFLGAVPLLGTMVLVFAAAMPLTSRTVGHVIEARRYRVVALLFAIALLPALLSFDALSSDGLLDSTYGRDRVLLGYWHPKEAGICFGVPALLLVMMSRRRQLLVAAAAAALIAVVGSRNVALVVLLSALLRLHGRLTLLALGSGMTVLVAWLVSDPALLDALDVLASLRITVWTDALSEREESFASLDVLGGERVALDNFFVEAFLLAGPPAFALALLWIAGAGMVTSRSTWPRVAFGLLLVFANFDSGIASTGNLMHALLWSVMLWPLFHRRARLRSRVTALPPRAQDATAAAS